MFIPVTPEGVGWYERLLRMNYVPFDSNRTLVRIRTGFFVLFSVFKKRMTHGQAIIFLPGGALSPLLFRAGRVTKLTVPGEFHNQLAEKIYVFPGTRMKSLIPQWRHVPRNDSDVVCCGSRRHQTTVMRCLLRLPF